MVKLKPCPFCGGKVKIVNMGDIGDFYMIVCMKCPVSTGFGFKSKTKRGAIEAWNERTNK